jgi:hypothetical protein
MQMKRMRMKRLALMMAFTALGMGSTGCSSNKGASGVDTPAAPDIKSDDATTSDLPNDIAPSDTSDDAGAICSPPCEGLDQCIDGVCQTPQICEPGTWVCHGLTAKKECAEDGMGFSEPQSCPGEQLCSSGQCALKCNMDPKWGSFVGCVFWTVDLPVWDDPTLPKANVLPHAVVVSNPNEFDATISFTPPPGVTFNFTDLTVPGQTTKVFEFPSLDTSGSNIYNLAIRVESNRPVLVHQFNPWDNTYSNDASLLLPEPMLGQTHYVLSWPTDARSLIEFPIPGLENFGGPSSHGFVSVVAPYDNTTVIVRTTARVNGTEVPAGFDPATYPMAVNPMPPGSVQTFVLDAGQVLNLDAMPETIMETADFTGTLVQADKPVAVFSGHDSAAIAAPNPGIGGDDDGCCLDHLEEQMPHVSLLGNTYVAGKTKPRGGEKDLWRIVAADNNVQIQTDPPIDGLHGKTLSLAGEWVEAYTEESFEITATGRILVGQYLVAQGQTDQGTGDPSMMLAVPIERFRSTYPIMVPSSYDKNFVTVVRPAGTPIEIDGSAVPDSDFTAFGSGAWEIGYITVSHGIHGITGDVPFSLSAYGYDNAASYAYPGGMTIPGEANP